MYFLSARADLLHVQQTRKWGAHREPQPSAPEVQRGPALGGHRDSAVRPAGQASAVGEEVHQNRCTVSFSSGEKYSSLVSLREHILFFPCDDQKGWDVKV